MLPLIAGCQISYLVKSASGQADLLRRRVPIEEALKDPELTDEQKRKLRLAEEARAFAESELGLKRTLNYTSFVRLKHPYVTWVVSAAPKNELKAYNWKYPLVGALPYKGYFDPESAKTEAESLKAEGYDVYVRGVTAYSTLGWFRDPLLSSMLAYKDHDLVNTIIHETVHATIYIKSQADFNERLATFFGNKGVEEFYKKREGDNGTTRSLIENEKHDERVFSEFMAKEIADLGKWYEQRRGVVIDETERLARLASIKERFRAEVRPRLRVPNSYKNFEASELNNARLLVHRLYNENLDDFETLFRKLGSDFHKMLDFCKKLEGTADPRAELAAAIGKEAAAR